jgi:hypothetical protein
LVPGDFFPKGIFARDFLPQLLSSKATTLSPDQYPKLASNKDSNLPRYSPFVGHSMYNQNTKKQNFVLFLKMEQLKYFSQVVFGPLAHIHTVLNSFPIKVSASC